MRLLLDTHTILWFLADDPKLSKNARKAILQAEAVFWNQTSLWEISIKINRTTHNLQITKNWSQNIPEKLASRDIFEIPTTPSHYLKNSTLPWLHRDPFDRLLIAIAIQENLTIITRDTKFSHYPVKTLW